MTTASQAWEEEGLGRLPKPVLDKMRGVIRRVRRVAICRGVLVATATGLVCLLAIMAVDAAVTIFSSGLRWALSLGGLAITAAAGWWWIFRPATQRITLASIARFVERRHPELQETLSSAIELLASDDPDEIRGSRELIGEVVKAAEREATRVSPAREVDTAAMRKSALVALGLAGILALIFTLWPSPARRLVLRAVAPFLEVGNVYADTLVVEPGDVRVAKGAEVRIMASVRHPRLDRATVRRLDAGAKGEGVERMTFRPGKGDRREFVVTFPNVSGDFSYRIHAGNALSRSYRVSAVEPPRVEKLSLRIEPAVYTGLAASAVEWTGQEIVVPEYARVTYEAKVNRSEAEADLWLGEKPVPLEKPLTAGACSWIVDVPKGLQADWRIELKDAEGFTSDPAKGSIRANPDQVPAVRILSPEGKELRLRPDEMVPLVYGVGEDFGFSRVELVVAVDGKTEPVVLPQAPPVREGENWQGRIALELAPLGLVSGQVLRVRLRVADNLPEHLQGPQIGESETLVIRLDTGAKAMVEQVVQSQQQEMQRELNEVRRDLREAKSLNEQLRREMQQPQALTPRALERLDQTRKEMVAAEERLAAVAARMEATLFEEAARGMETIAREQLQPALEKVEMIPLSDSREERMAATQDISKKLDEALRAVEKVSGEVAQTATVAGQMVALEDLAKSQEALAQAAAEQVGKEVAREAMAAENPQAEAQAGQQAEREMREWQRRQQQVEAKLSEMLKESPEAMAEVLREQEKEAAALAEKSGELAKEQAKLKEVTARMADPKAAASLQKEVMKQLQEAQAAIAEESAGLSKEMSGEEAAAAPEFGRMLTEAAKDTAEAAKEMEKASLQPADAAAARALGQLKAASRAAARSSAGETMRQEARAALEKALPAGTASTPEMREALRLAAEEVSKEALQSAPGTVPPDRVRQVAEQAARPLVDPAKANPGSVAEAGREAVRMLQALRPPGATGQAEEPVPAAPADSAMAARLSDLSERQEKVAGALAALSRGQTKEAVAALQEAITDDAMKLVADAESMKRRASLTRQQQAQSFADQAGRQFQQALAQAKAAEQSLEQAQMMEDQAQAAAARASNPALSSADAMAKAQAGQLPAAQATPAELQRVEQARQAQQRAEEALTMAAERLAQSGRALADAAKKPADPRPNGRSGAKPSVPVESQDLAQSFAQASGAAKAADSSQAAAQARQAAQALSQMARQAAQNLGGMSDLAGPGPGEPNHGEPGKEGAVTPASRGAEMRQGQNVAGDGVPPELAKMGISVADWARIKGALGSEATNQAASGAPKEYRDLVSDYFRIIATEAGK